MVIFHKTEVQTVILMCLMGLNSDWFNGYDPKSRYFHFQFLAILYKNTHLFCVFAFYVITFLPNKIQTRKAPQNDRLNLSFVKDTHTVGKRMARYGRKMAIYQLLFFES